MQRASAPTSGPFLSFVPSAALAAVLSAVLSAAPASLPAQELPQAPYVTTPTGTVQRMLELVEVTAADTVYDLGSGDGRIPIIAAARYGATAVGVELRRDLVEEARRGASSTGVADRVRFVHDDLFDVDLAPATVVTVYLLPSVNLRLRPKLLRELRPGTRVVSNGFTMGEWEPDRAVRELENHMVLYAWIVPADVSGRWRLTTPGGREVVLDVAQRFQELRVEAAAGAEGGAGAGAGVRGGPVAAEVEVVDPALEGADLSFGLALPGGGEGKGSGSGPVRYRGTVTDGRMEGVTAAGGAWSAVRISGPDPSLERWESGPG